jgi:hypothetical protein
MKLHKIFVFAFALIFGFVQCMHEKKTNNIKKLNDEDIQYLRSHMQGYDIYLNMLYVDVVKSFHINNISYEDSKFKTLFEESISIISNLDGRLELINLMSTKAYIEELEILFNDNSMYKKFKYPKNCDLTEITLLLSGFVFQEMVKIYFEEVHQLTLVESKGGVTN